ncbi:MAG: histidine kinase [Rhodospirillales bacterium]|nr:histidine kinase [Rhodospirillales bacterium]
MSLRFGLILPVALMLMVSLMLGGGLAWLHAVRSVATEMDAALVVGQHTVQTVIPYMSKSSEGAADLQQLIDTFDGDRHLRATLIGNDGRAITTSSLFLPPHPVPRWFARALGSGQPSARLALSPGHGEVEILLETDAGNELTEIWTEFGDDIQILLVFSAVTFPMIYWISGRALRPLGRVSNAFTNIGPSMSIQPIPEGGPPELVRLARGFNAMIDRLALAETRNRRLNEQLSTIQEEERAEIARDLHDEIGPYLFVMGVDAAAIQKTATARGQADMAAQVQSVRESVAHVQQQVKEILGRLRSANSIEFGLKQALENLTSFWRSRQADVTITVTIKDIGTGFGEIFEGAIYRVVQESLNNAMRHGKPRCVTITIDASTGQEIVVEIADDGGGLKRSAGARGFGLRGMAERVTALGGDLDIRDRTDRSGVTVTARLPYPHEARTIAA